MTGSDLRRDAGRDAGRGAADEERAPGADRTWTDYSAEMRVSRNPLLRVLYRALGLICLGLGVAGAFLPGLPTTVWILVATFFFARSSPRFYNWILNHRWFGRLVRDFRAGLGVPLWVKVLAIGMIALFAGSAALWLIPPLWARLVVAALGAAGVIYLLRLPTRELDPVVDGRPRGASLARAGAALLLGALGGALLRGAPVAALLAAGSGAVIAAAQLLVPARPRNAGRG